MKRDQLDTHVRVCQHINVDAAAHINFETLHIVFLFFLKEFCRTFVLGHSPVFSGSKNVTNGVSARKIIVS